MRACSGPRPMAENFDLVGDFPFPSSDHRLVYTDVAVARPGANQNRVTVTGVEAFGRSLLRHGGPSWRAPKSAAFLALPMIHPQGFTTPWPMTAAPTPASTP
jgi:hypothetical protein